MIRRPPRSTQSRSSAASDVYKRQDVAASVALDAFAELIHPVLEPLLLAQAVEPLEPLAVRHRRHPLPRKVRQWIGLRALARVRLFLVAGNPEDNYAFLCQLRVPLQFQNGPFVAPACDDAEARIRVACLLYTSDAADDLLSVV